MSSSAERRASANSPAESGGGSLEKSPLETSLRRMTSTEAIEKGDYRRIQNEMQIMTFKVRALEEKVEKIVKGKKIFCNL